MNEDPIIKEVRQIREHLAGRFDFDVHAIFADIRRRQALLGARLVRRPKKARPQQPVPTDRDSVGLHPGR